MTAAITHQSLDEAIELALVEGDLSRLTSAQRRQYYLRVCDSVGLNPLTKPFEYLRLNGKMLLYATKACTDQLRATRGVSVDIVKRVVDHGVCEVTAKATLDGRADTDVGAVYVENLKGEALANAVMKAHTKAKRRVTLSICGLSILDESEIETIRGAERVEEPPGPPQLPPPQRPASTPPPALHEGGLGSAIWSGFQAELTQASTLTDIQAIAQRIGKAKDRMTLTQLGQLRELTRERKAALKAPKSVDEVLGDNELPAAWGGPPEVDAVEETCVVCLKPLGASPAVQVENADGEVGFRHQGCSVREPGED